MTETLFTIEEVAQKLQVHPVTVRRLIAEKKMEIVRVGRQIRISESAFNRYLREHTSR